MGIFNKDFRQAAAAGGGASSTAMTLALTVTGATATQSWRKDDVEFSTSASVAVNPVTDGSTYSVVVVPTKNGVLGVAATATDVTFTYQWQYRDDDIGAWNSIGGATSATYVLADFVDERRYQCVVTGTNNRTAGTDPIVRYYTASDTWTKPAGLARVSLLALGGGGGGGSGRNSVAPTVAFGGGGASGGAIVHVCNIPASVLGATEDVTIGAFGAGGVAVSTDNTTGNNGAHGGDTSFGAHVKAPGGRLGTGGSTTSGAGGGKTMAAALPSFAGGGAYNQFYCNQGVGSAGGATGGGAASAGTKGVFATSEVMYGGPGGSGGGGVNAAGAHSYGGHAGSAYGCGTQVDNVRTSTTNGAAGINGTDNAVLDFWTTSDNFTYWIGTGGVGGNGGTTTVDGGIGGNGGDYGAGGGGGGGQQHIVGTQSSGAGGDGGDGLLIVIEYYGA
jgi:hypothetical protein